MKNIDPREEKNRYDAAYSDVNLDSVSSMGYSGLFEKQRLQFQKLIQENISDGMNILELAAGDGEYSKYTFHKRTNNTITDISINGLKAIEDFVNENNVKANTSFVKCDMQSLPFPDEKFDVVVIAKSLSYGNKKSISEEVSRVLKNKGVFIVLDQLFDNPVYSLNRWIKYKKGTITKSSYINRLKIKDLKLISQSFSEFRFTTHGALFFLYPVLRKLISEPRFSRVCDEFERRFPFFKTYGFTVVAIYHK